MLIGVVPAWFDWPSTVSSVHEMPCTDSTAPIRTPSRSRTGPCSMCSSTNACGAGQRLDHLETGQDPVVAVVATSGPDGVDVRAGHHRRPRLPTGAGGDDVADGVDGDVEAQVAHHRDHEVATEAVVVGERQSAV